MIKSSKKAAKPKRAPATLRELDTNDIEIISGGAGTNPPPPPPSPPKPVKQKQWLN